MKHVWVGLIIILASIFNTFMDIIKFHPNESVFSLIQNEYIRIWILETKPYLQEWMRPLFPFLYDGWHFAKQVMVGLFIGTISYFLSNKWKERLLCLLIYALIWMVTHMIFYDKVLLK